MRLQPEALSKPEPCEGCGAITVLERNAETGLPEWREIMCVCALAELERGLDRYRWCYTELHTPQRCRDIRAELGPLPPIKIDSLDQGGSDELPNPRTARRWKVPGMRRAR